MKNNDEMYQSLLSRYEEYQQKKKKRLLVIGRVVPALACFCFCAILGLGYWNHIQKLPNIPIQSSVIEKTTIKNTDTTTTQINSETEPVSTIVPVSTSKTEQITTTIGKKTVVTNRTEAHTTEQVTTKQTGTQSPATTAPVIQTTMNNEQQTTTFVQTTEETTVTTINKNIYEIKFGYKDNSSGYSAPSTPIRIVMKCMSFCEYGEKLSVDTAMADESSRPIYYDLPVDYVYEVNACNPLNFQNIEDNKIIINSEHKEYQRKYLKEEYELFDINGQHDCYDLYHHEITEMDFSCYEVGDSGCIKFAFKAIFNDKPDPSYIASNQFMYFYVGEVGISISNISIEDAMNNYQTVTMT